MFDIVRNNKKVIQIVLAIIILPFAFFGVDSLFTGGGSARDVAKVGDSRISLPEFQEALREQQDRLRPALGGQNPAMLESPQLKRAVLDNLVQRRLLLAYAQKSGMAVSDDQLVRLIVSVPSLQENGQFSPERYDALIASRNMSKAQFEHNLRQDLVAQQALMAVGDASVAATTGAGHWLAAQMESREISEATLRPEQYQGAVKVGAEAVKAYYDANQDKFRLPEMLRAEYLLLSRDRLVEQATVSDEEIKSWYQARSDRYKQPEERSASHVLIRLDKGAAADQVKAAEAKAAEILAQAKKSPGDFAKLAKQHSQDPGSADKGGDLGWFGRGMMVKPFEDAVFALKEGQISDVVRSDFGLHIIKLAGIRAERSRPLDEARGEIVAELKAQHAAKKYAETAESFSNTVYEQPDSLAPAAEKYQLTVQQSDWLAKDGGARGPLGNAKLLAALFSEDAIKNKRNTEAVEVAPNVLVSARVLEHKPASLQPLETVAPTIEKLLAHQEAVKLATQAGEARLAALAKGEKTDIAWGTPRTVMRSHAPNLSPEATRAVFRADTAKLPAYVGATGTGGAYVLYRISQVKPFAAGTGEQPQAAALRTQYARLVAEEEMFAWVNSLKQRFPIEINKALLETPEK
jgi:peptidyl-prolyl cis-trans isomerase D